MGQIIGDPQPIAPGEALVQELLWVHDALRQDLRIVQRLADRVSAGATAAQVHAEVADLRVNSAIWKFRANCLFFCRFVHGHHSLEDQHIFPRLRASDPALNPVVDRLESDHRLIAGDIHAIEVATDLLAQHEDTHSRAEVVTTLERLATRLLEHLAYEEETITPTLRTWNSWL